MAEIPLTAHKPCFTDSFLFSQRFRFFTMKMHDLALEVFIRNVGICVGFETPKICFIPISLASVVVIVPKGVFYSL